MPDKGDRASGGVPARRALGACIFEYIDRIRTMRDADRVAEAMGRQLADFGIDYFMIGCFADSAKEARRGMLVDRMHPGWAEHIIKQGYAERNPVLSGAIIGAEPVCWSDLIKRDRSGEARRRLEEAKVFGIYDSLNIRIDGSPRSVLANFSGRHIDISSTARIAMHAIALYTHSRLVKLRSADAVARGKLTRREADCLSWVAQGKSDWEIGEILSIGESTVHWYVEQAKRKLGVATRMQAVVVALQDGGISP